MPDAPYRTPGHRLEEYMTWLTVRTMEDAKLAVHAVEDVGLAGGTLEDSGLAGRAMTDTANHYVKHFNIPAELVFCTSSKIYISASGFLKCFLRIIHIRS